MNRILRTGATVAVSLLLASGTAVSASRELAVGSARAIQREDGEARVLFRVPGLAELTGQFVTGATLEIPLARAAAERDVDVYLFAVSQDWTDGAVSWTSPWRIPGGEWDLDHYAIANLGPRNGTGVLRFDVSTLVRAMVDGDVPAHGFILTAGPAEGVGRFRPEDLAALGDLSNATLSVSFHRAKRMPDWVGLPDRTGS